MWGHEYVNTSLLENAVSWEINEGGPQSEATLNLPYPQPTLNLPSTYPHPRPRAMSVWEAP